jgi:hypothetical protein
MAHPSSLFGADGDRYLVTIDDLQLEQIKTRYMFTPLDKYTQFIRDDPEKSMKIYWSEILSRAHWTAITSIFRNRRWVSAITSAVRDRNALAFAAALRGLMESAGDTQTALNNVPGTLARDHVRIKDAVLGKSGRCAFIIDEMENQLVHFAYARKLKRDEIAPATHQANPIQGDQGYFEILEKGKVPRVAELYRKLCDFTHPGASSVWLWLRPHGEYEVEVTSNQEEEVISWFVSEYRQTLSKLLQFGFNGPVITLAVLNYFPVKSLHTPALRSWDLSSIPLWGKIERELAKSG